MLVLSRRIAETIVIDGNIEIEVLKIKGNTVRLGIKAPRDVKVLRGELSPFGIAGQTFEIEAELDSALFEEAALLIAQAG